ncbi:MAG: hypothetical protein M3499_00095 [Actinomycetota bacterium]|nr:hypothetical protein [Actinomycetota bacterium]
MSPGLFDRHPVSSDVVRAAGDEIAATVEPLTAVLITTVVLHGMASAAVDGQLEGPLRASADPVRGRILSLVQGALVGAGAVRVFGDHVLTFDTGVDALNVRWASAQEHGFGVPLTDGQTAVEHEAAVDAARGQLLAELTREYAALDSDLDDGAETVAGLLDAGPVEQTVLALYRAGALPITAALLFGDVTFRAADHVAALRAHLDPGPGPGLDGDTPTLEEILERYQVGDDPDGVQMWPSWPLSMAVDQVQVTGIEAGLLNRLGLLALRDMQGMRDDAFSTADERFVPEDQNDNHNDAFRHAYWNALMTRRFGADWAEDYATAHEGVPGNAAVREAMDLYNNEVGRRLAETNPDASEDEIADLIEQAVLDGDMVVVGPDGNLVWSNTIPEGSPTGEGDQHGPGPEDGNPDNDPDEYADPDSHNDEGTGS